MSAFICLVRFLTRPTNHPRHAVCASNDESKPVRPQIIVLNKYPCLRFYATSPNVPERLEWRWKSHLNLWLERSRNQQPLTRIASRHPSRGSRLQTNPGRVGDFVWRIRGGRAAISAAAPVNFREGRRFFFLFQRVDAPDCARSFVRISANASVLNLRCDRIVTTNSVFLV